LQDFIGRPSSFSAKRSGGFFGGRTRSQSDKTQNSRKSAWVTVITVSIPLNKKKEFFLSLHAYSQKLIEDLRNSYLKRINLFFRTNRASTFANTQGSQCFMFRE